MPEPLRRMHALDTSLSATGRAKVERGDGVLARLVFQRGHRLPTLFIGRIAALGSLDE
jgi:hypothetical protein